MPGPGGHDEYWSLKFLLRLDTDQYACKEIIVRKIASLGS